VLPESKGLERSKSAMRPLLIAFLSTVLRLVFAIGVSAVSAQERFAEKGDILGRKDMRFLTLRDAIAYALENNLDVAVERFGPQISEQDVIEQKATFDPVFTASASVEKRVTPVGSRLETEAVALVPLLTDFWRFNTRLSKKTITGADIYLEYVFTRRTTSSTYALVNPSYESDFRLHVEQPLLRGAGIDYNRSAIKVAKLNKKISEFELQTQLMNTVAEVQYKYWALVQAIEGLKIARKSLKRAQDLLENNIQRRDAGIIPPIQVTEAEAEVATQQENIVKAENDVRNAESDLKQVMNLPDLPVLSDTAIVPVDKPISTPKEIDWVYCVEKALSKRPDFLAQKAELERNKVQIKVTKNELYPQIDLIASFNLNGLGNNFANDNDLLFSTDYYDAYLGFEVTIPLGGNRAAKARYTRAQLEAAQQLRNLKKMELKIITEVREAVRQVRTNLERIRATRKARELQQERVDAIQKMLDVGRATTFEVLSAQEDLAVAEGNELSAIIDYNTSLVTLSQLMGTILDELNIIVEEEEIPR